MTGLFGSSTLLWVAVAALAVAALIGLVVVIVPGPARIPVERRRPGVDTAPNPLGVVATATTDSIERLIRGRGGNAATLLERAGVKQPLKDVIVLVGAGMFAGAAIGLLLGGPWIAVGLFFAVPLLARLVLGIMVDKRQKTFANQLDETLQILAGSLRAGYSLPQAVSTVAVEAEAPTSEEFARIVNETRVGRALEEALLDAAIRTKNEDFYWITQAIAINREVGGNLADVLDGVGRTIRERSQLRRQVQSLAAEGKLSAIILGALPFALFGMLWMGNRQYVMLLFTHPVGNIMLVIGVVLLTIGIIWLRKTIQIKY